MACCLEPLSTDFPTKKSGPPACCALNSTSPSGLLILVNGKIGGGSPPAGPAFWHAHSQGSPGFVDGALRWVHAREPGFAAVDFPSFSQAHQRFKQGYAYWQKWRPANHRCIHLVSHSMGAAFAEGLLAAAEKWGYKAGWVVQLNPYQAADLAVSSNRIATIDYQFTDDPLIHNSLLKLVGHANPGAIKGATYHIRLPSGIRNPLKRHRGFIGRWGYQFWPHLDQCLRQ